MVLRPEVASAACEAVSPFAMHSLKGKNGSCMEMTRHKLSRSLDPGTVQAVDQSGSRV